VSVLTAIRDSSGLYPITQFYVVAVLVVIIAVEGWIGVGSAIAILGIFAALAILTAAWSELKLIHKMVNSQRTETLARMDQLEDIIVAHGITLPPEGWKVSEARSDAESTE
jgi:hypothetical protein